jgi:hypothetical protein
MAKKKSKASTIVSAAEAAGRSAGNAVKATVGAVEDMMARMGRTAKKSAAKDVKRVKGATRKTAAKIRKTVKKRKA